MRFFLLLVLVVCIEARSTPTCSCAKIESYSPGNCYYFLDTAKSRCRARKCKAGFVCTPGKKTGLTCIRRKIISKVVPAAPGTCTEKTVVEYLIVPYIGRYRPQSLVLNKIGEFIVVADNKVVNRYMDLYRARNVLNSFKRGSRCIFQVKKGYVASDPHTVAGYAQLPRYGFQRSWADWYDIRRMHRTASLWYALRYRPVENIQGIFIVVVGTTVIRKFRYLRAAMHALRHHRKVSRCIFEVRGTQVSRDPHRIAGYKQSPDYGFDVYWNHKTDMHRMYKIAKTWYITYVRTHKIVGEFLVVSNTRVVGRYTQLFAAQHVLRTVTTGPRCIFQVRGGRVQDPHVISGMMQLRMNGFNSRWGGWHDINRMRRAATFWYADRFMNVKNIAGTFLVVDGHTSGKAIITRYNYLRSAIIALRRHKKKSRAIFEVKNGVVMGDPRTIAGYKQTPDFGFDRRWINADDIRRMHHMANIWNIRMRKAGMYLVVANKRVIGQYSRLYRAQKVLSRFKSGSRCIFEVKKNNVMRNPRFIAGIEQKKENFFNVAWGDLKDLRRIALLWFADRHRKVNDVKGTFIVVHNNKAKKYNRLRLAMRALRRRTKISRCIFEVKNNALQRDPHNIAGYTQNPENGFDKYWKGWNDIKRMYGIAIKFV